MEEVIDDEATPLEGDAIPNEENPDSDVTGDPEDPASVDSSDPTDDSVSPE